MENKALTKKAMLEQMKVKGYLVRCSKSFQNGKCSKSFVESMYKEFLKSPFNA